MLLRNGGPETGRLFDILFFLLTFLALVSLSKNLLARVSSFRVVFLDVEYCAEQALAFFALVPEG